MTEIPHRRARRSAGAWAVLAMLPGIFASEARANFVQFVIPANADVVAESSGPAPTGLDGSGRAFLSASQAAARAAVGEVGNGLPDNGQFPVAGGTVHLLPYTFNNVVRFTGVVGGTFTVNVNPDKYLSLTIYANCGDGAGTFTLSLNYSDGKVNVTGVTVPDWLTDPPPAGDAYLIDGLDRTLANGAGFEDSNDPAIFAIPISPDRTRTLNSITITHTSTGDAMTFFAVTGDTSVNEAPVADSQSVTTNEDTAKAITLTGSDANGDTLTFSVVTQPAHGTLSGTAPNLTYTPNANYNGSDSFTFKANDGSADSNTATVSITINAVNDAPSFTKGPNQTTIEGSGPQTANNWATNISPGPANESAQSLAFIVSSNNTTLFSSQPAISSNGTLTYTPASNANGSATVTVVLMDNGGTANNGHDTSAARTFTITVAAPTPTPAPTATPSPTPQGSPGAAQSLNISTRLNVDTGDKIMIAGFIIQGNDSKPVLLRGMGPSLAGFGIQGVLLDPVLELRDSNSSLMTNDNWVDSPERSQFEGGPFQPNDDRESVILGTLAAGNYTALLTGKKATAGVGIVEVYDRDQTVDAQLANISTRGFVQGGDNVMIGGFILGGSTNNARIAIRGIGPSLTQFGLNPALADPTLELHDANGVTLVANDNWKDDPVASALLTANGLGLSDPKESGIFTALPAGQFTAILAGKNGGVGIGLIEIYNLQ
jgi:hypothetical protein